MGRKWIALIGLVVVAVILIIQIAQGESNALHWIGLVAVAVALVATAVDMTKTRNSLN